MGKHVLYHSLFGKQVVLSKPMTLTEIRKLKSSLDVRVDGRKATLKTKEIKLPAKRSNKPSAANKKVITKAKKKPIPNAGKFTNAQIKQFEKNIEKAALSLEPWATKMFYEIVEMIKKYPPGYALGKKSFLWKQPNWIIPQAIEEAIRLDTENYVKYLNSSKKKATPAQIKLLEKEIADERSKDFYIEQDIQYLTMLRNGLKKYPAAHLYDDFYGGETAARDMVPRSIYKLIIGA